MLEKYLPRITFDSYEDFKRSYTVNIPDNFNFGFDVVDGWAEAEPGKKALVWCNDHGEERTFTFRDISRLSNQAANFFSSIGIKKGTIVMMIMRRRWEYWVCATALHKIGAILIPASLQLTSKDIIYRAKSALINTIISLCDEFVITQIEAALPEVPCVVNKIVVSGKADGWISFDDSLAGFSDVFKRPTGELATANTDTMLLYFTSGTTSLPKMVCHNFLHPLGHIVTAKYWQQVEENKLHMSVADSAWAKFGWGKIYGQWICGAVIFAYDMEKFSAAKLLAMLQKYKVTTFCVPPTMYRFMLQEDIKQYDLSSLHHCSTAGEPLNPEVVRQWQERTGHMIYEGFGQSESTVILANFEWDPPKPGSTGKPSPIYDIRLLDENGNESEDGEEGAICVMDAKNKKPVGLFTGYYADEKLTEDKLYGKCYNLGDMAWRDSDGYYWFIGRQDDIIKCSGYRIGPFEVESALIEHPAVVECAITGAPDPIRGQVVKATVVLAKGFVPSDKLISELQEHVKHVTAPYKYPRVVEFVDELPKTLGGKIKRAQIRTDSANNA
ncbi:MAG: AMP-binding protein [Clostridiales bacterium]|jgi:acetyl-CoA synthetase|nr:AMP-binding protein [Clostridiales bacterium]